MKTHAGRSRAPGFTLVEVLVVLSIVAILAAWAVPSYTAHVARAHRAQARAQLLMAAQYLQRFYAANDTYLADRTGTPVAELMPTQFLQSPGDGPAVYMIGFGEGKSSVSATEFKLLIEPVAGRAMQGDACGGLTLDSVGRRGVTAAGADRDACWR